MKLIRMTATGKGREAEAAVANYLRRRGYLVICKNWRTSTCEIDLVVYKKKIVSFVEVKFRSNAEQGSGFDYVTITKLKRMSYAAHLWVAKNNWRGRYQLSVASVTGLEEIEFIENIV